MTDIEAMAREALEIAARPEIESPDSFGCECGECSAELRAVERLAELAPALAQEVLRLTAKVRDLSPRVDVDAIQKYGKPRFWPDTGCGG